MDADVLGLPYYLAMKQWRWALLLGWASAALGAPQDCNENSFRTPVRYAVAADEVVLVNDLDGDGAPEIVTSGNHVDQVAAFSVLPNSGGGVFGNERQIVTGYGETLEEVVDQNHDGMPDLLASSYWQNGMVTYRATGPLQFNRTAFDTATHGGPTRSVDYDGDGLNDLVSFSFGSGNPVRLHLFRAKADGTFDTKMTLDTSLAIAASPTSRIHDGHLEILVSEHSGHLGLFRFEPGGVSVSRLDAGPGFDLNSLFIDVNEDGIADIVDTNDAGTDAAANAFESIFVTLGKPDGGFGERKQLPHARRMSLPTELRAADLDRDGHVDLIVSDFRASTLYYLRGRGTGSFDEAIAINAGGPINDIAIADVNGDRRPDLVTVNNDHSVSVIMNDRPCSVDRRRAVRH